MELIPLIVFWVVVFETVRLLGMCREESRSSMYSLVVAVWAIVAIYAFLHDQCIVRIAPSHFTEFHEPMWGIRFPKVLAAAYAFRSSWYPGVLLGMACALAARADSMPRLSPLFVLKSVAGILLMTEFVAAVSGGPDSVYLVRKLSLDRGTRIVLGHVNYGTRGSDSAKDQELVEIIGKSLGYNTEIFVANRESNVTGYKGASGTRENFPAGFEKKAREIRYRFLKDL